MKEQNLIPEKVEVYLQSEVFKNFRCRVACNSLDIDANKKSIHHLVIDGIKPNKDWNIGLIYGASGSGKTTLAQKLFGPEIFQTEINLEEPVINQLPKEFTYDECVEFLTSIGLNSVPCWVRPMKTLSNGQRARAEAILQMTKNQDIVVIDEFTSVVDRTVAKVMAQCLHKFAKKHNKKIILLSCHYDILEWLLPDWLIDCNEQKFTNRDTDAFFLSQKKSLSSKSKKSVLRAGNTLANITI